MALLQILALVTGLDIPDSPLLEAFPPIFEQVSILNDSEKGTGYKIQMIEFNTRRPGEKIWSGNILSGPIGPMQSVIVNIRLSGRKDCKRDIRLVLKNHTTSDYPDFDVCVEYHLNWTYTTDDEGKD